MFCKNCGEEINDGARFCGNCGAVVGTGAPQDYPDDYSDKHDTKELGEAGQITGDKTAVTALEDLTRGTVQGSRPAEKGSRKIKKKPDRETLIHALVCILVCVAVIVFTLILSNKFFEQNRFAMAETVLGPDSPEAELNSFADTINRGKSLTTEQGIAGLVFHRIWNSVLVMLLPLIPAALLAILLGSIEKRWAKAVLSVISAILRTLFPIGLAFVLLLRFSIENRIFPAAGLGSLKHYVLPFLTLFLPTFGFILRDAITPREEQGLEGSSAAVLSSIGKHLGQIIAAEFIVETIFNIPGLGKLLVDSMIRLDHTVMLYVILVTVILSQICGGGFGFISYLIGKRAEKRAMTRISHGHAVDTLAMCGVFAAVIFVIIVMLPKLAPYPDAVYSTDLNSTLRQIGGAHVLGTDQYGRDIFSRLLFGVGTTVTAALEAAVISLVIGLVLGTAAGLLPGRFHREAKHVLGVFGNLPILLFILVLPVLWSAETAVGTETVILVIGLLSWGGIAERTAFAVHEKGSNRFTGVFVPIVEEFLTLMGISFAVCIEMSFIGIGVQPPNPDIGNMIRDGLEYLRISPWCALVPTLAAVAAGVLINTFQTAVFQRFCGMFKHDAPKEEPVTVESD